MGRKPLQERIEPPILMSRLMAFVMATAAVVLVVLLITLDKMFPLNRPQIFFLTTQGINDKEITLTQMPEDLDGYKRQFIREYIRYRNEIIPNISIMRARWAPTPNGIIKSRSTDAIFGNFADTEMVAIIRQGDLDEPLTISCDVEFPAKNAVVSKVGEPNTYVASFDYVCEYGDLAPQKYVQKYQIIVKLESTEKTAIKWAERMENPLGFRVSGYTVANGQSDPLNWTQNEE